MSSTKSGLASYGRIRAMSGLSVRFPMSSPSTSDSASI